MEDFITFFSFEDPNIRYVTLGCLLLGITASLSGAFAFLRKQSLVGDAVAHAVFPGVCLAFLVVGEKKMPFLMLGAFATGSLGLLCIGHIKNRSTLKNDTLIALVLSTFFAGGVALLSFIQNTGNPHQSGLNYFLFGNAASLTQDDLVLFNSVALVTLLVLFSFLKEFMLISFDPTYAKSLGLPAGLLDKLLTMLMVGSIVIGMQTVGLVLIASLLIIPPTIARFWTHKFTLFLLLSALFGAVASLAGAYISLHSPPHAHRPVDRVGALGPGRPFLLSRP